MIAPGGFWAQLVDAAGMGPEDNYAGLYAALLLGFELGVPIVLPALRDARTIEKQVVAVLDQAYAWLGGAGSALDHYARVIEGIAPVVPPSVRGHPTFQQELVNIWNDPYVRPFEITF